MAEVQWSRVRIPYEGEAHAAAWDLASGDTGVAWPRPQGHISVQMTGNFGAGAVSLEGALNPVTPVYQVLYDANGLPMSGLVANYLGAVQPGVVLVRPVSAAGVTAVRITVLAH